MDATGRNAARRLPAVSRLASAQRAAGIAALTLALAAGCVHAAASPRPTRSLSPDSLALLHEALRHVRPAFTTQQEALRAGAYVNSLIATAAQPAAESPPDSRAAPAAAAAEYIVQIAAYRNRALAERAAAEAQRRFPRSRAIVETVGDVYRVGLGGWDSARAATADLPEIQRVYPGAWVRRRGVS